MQTLKIFAVLLNYPDDVLQQSVEELMSAVRVDQNLTEIGRGAVLRFLERIPGRDLFEWQAEYFEAFERSRARSLYLFEHVHGESRDRGQAMVDLNSVYHEHGFELAVRELPDYLPVFLEFLSTQTRDAAIGWLAEIGDMLQTIQARLDLCGSPYSMLFEPLVGLTGLESDPAAIRKQLFGEPRDDTPEAVDRNWVETPVTFGPRQNCGPASMCNPSGRKPEQGGTCCEVPGDGSREGGRYE